MTEEKVYDTTKLYLTRDKHLISIYSPRDEKTIRYNLKEKTLQKQDKKGYWVSTRQQYKFFKRFGVSSLIAEETKFKEMLQKTKSLNPSCYSVSTLFDRMEDALVYENYVQAGIRTECKPQGRYGRSYILRHGLEEYPKPIIQFFKDADFFVNVSFEYWYWADEKKSLSIMQQVLSMDKEIQEKQEYINFLHNNATYTNSLIKEYNYDVKALLGYAFEYLIPFEAFKSHEVGTVLRDYYRMASIIGRNVDKYPKYLKSMHDIIQSNYNTYKKEYDEELFKKLIKEELEYIKKDFCIVNPESSKDIISEGTDLGHCVSSYVDQILKERTYIFFLRETKQPEKSLVTLEYNNGRIVQARGARNRSLDTKERAFLKQYCKEKNIPLEA